MKHCLPIPGLIPWLLFSALSLSLLAFPAFADSSLEKEHVLLREYKDSIKTITQEIDDLKENLEWLEFKIMGMKNLDKPVPSHLYESVSYKKVRIDALEKKRQTLKKSLGKIAADILDYESSNQKTSIQNKIIDQIKNSGLFEWFELIPDTEKLKIRTTQPIFFASGSAVIPEEYNSFLKKVSSFTRDYKVWILVDGFADEDPIKTKQFPSNFELGAIRAANVVHALVTHGIDPSVFKVASTGKYRFPDERQPSEKKAFERYVNITICFETP